MCAGALNAEVWNRKWLAKLGDRHLADVGASPQFERGFRESAHVSSLVPWRISEVGTVLGTLLIVLVDHGDWVRLSPLLYLTTVDSVGRLQGDRLK